MLLLCIIAGIGGGAILLASFGLPATASAQQLLAEVAKTPHRKTRATAPTQS